MAGGPGPCAWQAQLQLQQSGADNSPGGPRKASILGVESQELISVNIWNLKCETVPNMQNDV